jgi:hypothetical protein
MSLKSGVVQPSLAGRQVPFVKQSATSASEIDLSDILSKQCLESFHWGTLARRVFRRFTISQLSALPPVGFMVVRQSRAVNSFLLATSGSEVGRQQEAVELCVVKKRDEYW